MSAVLCSDRDSGAVSTPMKEMVAETAAAPSDRANTHRTSQRSRRGEGSAVEVAEGSRGAEFAAWVLSVTPSHVCAARGRTARDRRGRVGVGYAGPTFRRLCRLFTGVCRCRRVRGRGAGSVLGPFLGLFLQPVLFHPGVGRVLHTRVVDCGVVAGRDTENGHGRDRTTGQDTAHGGEGLLADVLELHCDSMRSGMCAVGRPGKTVRAVLWCRAR